jgi:hypothetical protein
MGLPAEIPDAPTIRSSLVRIRVGSRDYDAIRNPRCRVCTSPARMAIEEQLFKGTPYNHIANAFSEVEYDEGGMTILLPQISPSSIRNHFKNQHMPIEGAVLREISEQRARELGSQYGNVVDTVLDGYTVAKAVLARGYERLARDEIQPDVRETLAAAKLVSDMENGRLGNVDDEVWSQAMVVYFETAREVMQPEQWNQFCSLLTRNPVLQKLEKKINAGPDEDVVEAEVVDN